MYKDITALVERIEAFEERVGVELAGLFAKEDVTGSVELNGELRSRNGTTLDGDLEVMVAIYDGDNRVIGRSQTYFFKKDFYGFEPFTVYLNVGDMIAARIKVFPKLSNYDE